MRVCSMQVDRCPDVLANQLRKQMEKTINRTLDATREDLDLSRSWHLQLP